MKKLLALVLIVCTLCFSGCGLFKELFAEMDKASNFVEDFCQCLVENDFATASTMLHPSKAMTASQLSAYIAQVEQQYGIDFSDGIGDKLSYSINSSGYDSNYNGGAHEIEFTRKVGDKKIQFYFLVVNNDDGYGIYSMDFDD